jgi:hypothetical protein
VDIDEKNGILFVGCKSGKVRSHVWPIKESSTFEHYSEIRVGFGAVSCLSLSNLSSILYVGSVNGNISKVKYTVDRDKGLGTTKEHNLLLSDRNFRYFSNMGCSSIEKTYKYVLTSTVPISS